MDLLVLGAGGHGGGVKEVAEATGKYNRIDFLDDHSDIAVGKLIDYEEFTGSYSHAFVAIGNPTIRNLWQDRLSTVGFEIPVLIHPDSYISSSAEINIGTVVMPKSVVQSNVRIGKGCIISAGAVIDHEALVGDWCHINAGAIVAAGSRGPNDTKVDYGEVHRELLRVSVANKEIEVIHK